MDDLTTLPEPAYDLIASRLVYQWMDGKTGFLNRVRQLLAPGATGWTVTKIAGRRTATDPALLGPSISPADAEVLTLSLIHI